NVTGHVIQAVVVGKIRLHGSGIGKPIVIVVTAARLEVGQHTALGVPDVGVTPRILGQVSAATRRILPLSLIGEAEGRHGEFTHALAVVVQIGSTPVAEEHSRIPIHTYDGIIVISRVPVVVVLD